MNKRMKCMAASSILPIALAMALASCGPAFHPTVQDVERDIVGKIVGDPMTGYAWTFQPNEKRTIKIVDIEKDGKKADVVLEMITQSPPQWFIGAQKAAGRLRLQYEYIADQWTLVRVENLSFKPV